MVSADLPTPPPPTTTSLYSLRKLLLDILRGEVESAGRSRKRKGGLSPSWYREEIGRYKRLPPAEGERRTREEGSGLTVGSRARVSCHEEQEEGGVWLLAWEGSLL